MKILVHTPYRADNVRFNLGRPEYSYYFVLRAFLPLLREIGTVIDIVQPEIEADAIYHDSIAGGEACVFLCFLPPNKVTLGLQCPTVPVFAWEYATLPNEAFGNKPRNDWRRVLKYLGAGITHSSFTAQVVHKALGESFPILVAPAPLWDGLSRFRSGDRRPDRGGQRISLDGLLIDSRTADLTPYSIASVLESQNPPALPDQRLEGRVEFDLEGIVYTSVFNPGDPRKNWIAMIGAFCEAFRYVDDVTLVLKLSHHQIHDVILEMLAHIRRGGDFRGRILIIDGYLDDDAYRQLIDATSFAVNTSHGEGQCLPLMEYMSCGIPAVAPQHTAMADYITSSCAFVVDSSPAPGTWPHDSRQAFRTLRSEVHFASLVRAYRASHHVARNEPETYHHMSAAAIASLHDYCSAEVVRPSLERFLHAVAATGNPSVTGTASR